MNDLVDYGSPVADHPDNRGLALWLPSLPPFAGGRRWYSPTRNRPVGTLVGGPTWTPGVRPGERVLPLDGTDDEADCGGVLSGSLTGLTIAGTVFRSATGNMAIVGWGDTGSSRGYWIWFTDGRCYLTVEAGAGVFPSFALAGTGTHRILMTYDGSDGTPQSRIVGYLNGVAQALDYSGSADPPTSYTVTGSFRVGREPASSRFATGWAAKVRLWNRALTAAEAMRDYQWSLRPEASDPRVRTVISEPVYVSSDDAPTGLAGDDGGLTYSRRMSW